MTKLPKPRSDFAIFKQIGSPTVLGVLDMLAQKGELRATDTAEALGVSKSAVSKCFSLLETLGLIKNNGKNTRNKRFLITRTISVQKRLELAEKLEEAFSLLATTSDRVQAVVENPQTDKDSIFEALKEFTGASAMVAGVLEEALKDEGQKIAQEAAE